MWTPRVTFTCVRLIVVVALAALVVTTARMDGHLRALGVPRSAMEDDMSTITFTKTLEDGTIVTLTVTQQPGETTEAFMARARAEWQAFCDQFGG